MRGGASEAKLVGTLLRSGVPVATPCSCTAGIFTSVTMLESGPFAAYPGQRAWRVVSFFSFFYCPSGRCLRLSSK